MKFIGSLFRIGLYALIAAGASLLADLVKIREYVDPPAKIDWWIVGLTAAMQAAISIRAYIDQHLSRENGAVVPSEAAPIRIPVDRSAQSGQAMPMTTGALALVCMAAAGWILLTCTGCVTTGLQAVQGVTDRAAAAYGQTDTLQTVREGLAEVEAQKTGRVLLPRNAKAIPGVYVDDLGTILTNGVTLSQWYVVQQRIADRVSAPPSPAGTLPMPAPAPPATAVAPAGDNLLNGPVTGTVTP